MRTRRARGDTTGELARRFAHTLVPIALAYVVAHYFSLLAYQGQALAYLASDPLGHGSDLLRHRRRATINYTWITATGIWYVQVARARRSATSPASCSPTTARSRSTATPRDATRSQYWMLAVMVAFTSLGLWLLSAAAQ